jgi:hypothetical protein
MAFDKGGFRRCREACIGETPQSKRCREAYSLRERTLLGAVRLAEYFETFWFGGNHIEGLEVRDYNLANMSGHLGSSPVPSAGAEGTAPSKGSSGRRVSLKEAR